MLRDYFYRHDQGPGIWKWDHYFAIYERHFEKFRGRAVHLLEIGVYSGGSLQMWRDYLGPQARIYGVDIQSACKRYDADAITVLIGDQGRPEFWRQFKETVPALDIVIDDGSHRPEHQITAFEQLLPHLRSGGVYCCEDLHGYPANGFGNYITRFAADLNDHRGAVEDKTDMARRSVKAATALQADVNSVHLYPYVAVIEKNAAPVEEFIAPKRGSEWLAFLE